ncbi:hypothetical protein HY375_02645 [Candidatus Berkelbacteria bacterium]|nr:hypothetical protein [Candidatus Berkelbacteria bacterium]
MANKTRAEKRGSGQSKYSLEEILRLIRSEDEASEEQLLRLPPKQLRGIPPGILVQHCSVRVLNRAGIGPGQDLVQMLLTPP